MEIIQLKEANCKNCYKCIRECPVKAISFKNEQASVIENECILCGKCTLVCPQNAKQVKSDLKKVKGFISAKNKVYLSLAPSYASFFKGADFSTIAEALKKLGFVHIEETSVGAAKVSNEYAKLLRKGKLKNIITTACTSIVLLVEKYYPDLIDLLAPVDSPMIAHGKSMREAFGNRVKIVFAGPCISKKHESGDILYENIINAVLSFEELQNWLNDEGISLHEKKTDPSVKKLRNNKARFYPMPGGVLHTLSKESRKHYKCISIDGIERCMRALDSIRKGEIRNFFIEMNACEGACLGGPCMRNANISFVSAKDDLVQNVIGKELGDDYITNSMKVNLERKFIDRSVVLPMPSESKITEILKSIGKTDPEQELNCGGCGYSTCRDKAIAVYQGKADPKMCLPFVRERAESLSNLVIDYTPNAIIVLDDELKIQEINPAGIAMLRTDKTHVLGSNIEEFLPGPLYEEVLNDRRLIRDEKMTYVNLGITVEQSIVYIPEQQRMLLFLKNITNEEKHRQSLKVMRENTLDIAQKVIDKQMRVAQEIASLLGETTAETKTALTKLKKSIIDDTGESYEHQS